MNMTSDLSSFSLSSFVDIHVLISATHGLIFIMQESLESLDEVMNDAYSWMSSAY